ncbi:MAG: PAS domain S-box protein, partial [Proteobacteria bacterium]|nr:PAS domain S-box protein [Pseudomonadota bacterium]
MLITVHDSADLAVPALLTQVTRELVRALDVDRVGVWQVAPSNNEDPAADAIIALHQHDRADGSHTSGQRLEARAFPAYFAALRTDAAIVADDAHAHPATAAFSASYLTPLGVVSMLDVPLRALDGLRGVMCVETRSPRTWSAPEISLCGEVGRLLVQAVERAERRALESCHAAILASIGDAVVACDLGGVITLVNPVAETLTGWSAARAIGQPLAAVVQLEPAAGGDAEPRLVDAVLATGQPQALQGTALLRRRDGSATPVAARATPLDHAGALGGAVLTFRDVATEQRTQRALEFEHARLRSISEALPDLLFTVTRDGRLRLNTRADHADLLVPAPEIPDHTLRTLFPADVADELLAKIARVIDSGQVESVEYTLAGPAGRQWFEARMARLGADEVTCIVRNVSEVREQLAAQREQRARLATVLESTAAMMYAAVLPTFEIDYLSDSAHAVVGYALEQFADPAFWQDRLHPDDRDRVLTESAELATRGHVAREYRFRHADGRWVWLHDELRVVRDERGEPVRAIGAA